MFRLHISKRAEKQIKLLKKDFQIEIINALSEIRDEPLLGKPLDRDLNGRFSYRIRVYRIIYQINHKDKVINILSAGHRAKIYD